MVTGVTSDFIRLMISTSQRLLSCNTHLTHPHQVPHSSLAMALPDYWLQRVGRLLLGSETSVLFLAITPTVGGSCALAYKIHLLVFHVMPPLLAFQQTLNPFLARL